MNCARSDFESIDLLGRRPGDHYEEALLGVDIVGQRADVTSAFAQGERIDGLAASENR
jgi:hypothetical protein